MNNLQECVFDFFFQVKRDSNNERKAKLTYLFEAIHAFLSDENEQTAYDVYTTFFDIYKLKDGNKHNFIDLLDVLHAYEENIAIVNEKQRDHYIHSVNVFVLGICIYSKNKLFAEKFSNKIQLEKGKYVFGQNEEFLLRWGIAALFHDIGYPIEIINNQLKGFISFVSGNKESVKAIAPFIEYMDFSKFNDFSLAEDSTDYCPMAIRETGASIRIPTDLISAKISLDYGMEFSEIKADIDSYLKKMQKYLFVDHGFYSAIIIAKWYAELTHSCVDKEKAFSLLYYTVLDAATAILLHNYYEKTLLPMYNIKMAPDSQPIAYLLALCDCAQEWNRKAYGYSDKKKLAVDSSDVEILSDEIRFHYITERGTLNEEFIMKKSANFESLFELEQLFPKGIKVSATTDSSRYIRYLQKQSYPLMARPLIDNLEKIAVAIHTDYVKKQQERGKDVPYQTWESLPDSLKYSNIRQAKTIFSKLELVGYTVEPNGTTPIKVFSETEIELMAEYEHELWVEERKKNGWAYGPEKNVEQKITPYLVPYGELSEEIKEYDRDTIRNIVPLLSMVGMAVYRN